MNVTLNVPCNLKVELASFTRMLVMQAMLQAHGNIIIAAKLLNLDVYTMNRYVTEAERAWNDTLDAV